MSSFQRAHLDELRGLGVTTEQLSELQRILPTCRAEIQAPLPSMTDVRDELTALQKVLEEASTALTRWESGRVQKPALVEARARVHVASFACVDKANPTGDAVDAVRLVTIVAGQALARLPMTQRRPQASWLPIYWIHEALVRGWGYTHHPIGTGQEPRDDAARIIPPFPHPASSGATSPFRKIVGICYDAALGTRDSDPERAIKAYMRLRKARRGTAGDLGL